MSNQFIKATAVASAVSGVLFAANASAIDTKALLEHRQSLLQNEQEFKAEQLHEVNAYMVVLKAESASDLLDQGRYSVAAAQQAAISIEEVQAQVLSTLSSFDPGAKVIAKTKILAATLIVDADEVALESLKNHPLVEKILPVLDNEIQVADVNKYISADIVNTEKGFTGSSQSVAVLDTGIDYTHKILGGEGTLEAYSAAAADQTSVTWPQGQVVGGYDAFRGDADPIENDPRFDATTGTPNATNHGTNVAHSVTGIAPGVELYAYTVCGDRTQNCSGAAQILALEKAMDPNGDGNISDRVDVINMSLGGDYGSTHTQSGTQYLIHKAVKLGTNLVISAGNDADHPFIVGGPSTTPNALSVGAMTHPVEQIVTSKREASLNGSAVAFGTASFGEQGPLSFTSEGKEFIYPDANQEACVEFAEGTDFTGKVVLVDRGGCGFSDKVLNAQKAGASFVIVVNNKANDGAFGMAASPGAEAVTIRSFMLSLEDGQVVKDAIANGRAFDLTVDIEETNIAGNAVAGFSSRGPSMDGLLKPEITAPGSEIVLAKPGSVESDPAAIGTSTMKNSGTSFSGPIVAGAVALVRDARPYMNAEEVKAVLMNTADLNVYEEALALNEDAKLAPISRIGAGLVDVNKAIESPVAAWVHHADFDTNQAALSFGLLSVSESSSYTKTVQVKNFSSEAKTYSLRAEARYADDSETGAFSWDLPEEITVPAGQTISFDATLNIDPMKLKEWAFDSTTMRRLSSETDAEFATRRDAEYQQRRDALTAIEYDGAIVFNDISSSEDHDLHLVFHAMPKALETLEMKYEFVEGEKQLVVYNTSAHDIELNADNLIASEDPEHSLAMDIISTSMNVYGGIASCPDGGRAITATMQLRDPVQHLRKGDYGIHFDINNDGMDDWVFYNFTDFNSRGTGVTGSMRGVSGAVNPDGSISWRYYVDIHHEVGSDTITYSSCDFFVGFGDQTVDVNGTPTVVSPVGQNIRVTATVGPDNGYSLGGPLLTTDTLEGTVTYQSSRVSMEDMEGEDVNKIVAGGKVTIQSDSPFVLSRTDLQKAVVVVEQAVLDEQSRVTPLVIDAMSFDVSEDAENGTVIGQLSLVEQEDALELSEYFVRSQSNEGINITKDGEIVVANSAFLDYDQGVTEVELKVVAIDVAGNVSEETSIYINVQNVADTVAEQTPMIAAEQIFEVNENAAMDTVVGQLVVMDQDDNIESFEVSGSDVFAIEADGSIVVKGEVDFDQAAEVMLEVVAVDADGNKSESVSVKIVINEDMSENVPVIAPNQVFTAFESAEVGSTIGVLSFADSDNDIVEFKVSGTAMVNVDVEGNIVVAAEFDYEFDKKITFTVIAIDARGNESVAVPVDIRVMQEHVPNIEPNQVFTVFESAEVGSSVGQLSFVDSDNDIVEFEVTDTALVNVDSEGRIIVAESFDYEFNKTITFSVIAIDARGNKSAAVPVDIRVMQEHVPNIEPNQVFTVFESAEVGSSVGQLSFVDSDNDIVEFEVTDTALVNVDSEGRIIVAESFDYEFNKTITFSVIAIDARGNKSAAVPVDIRVMQEHVPSIEPNQVFTILENVRVGYQVGQLQFLDSDNDVVSFEVSGTALLEVDEQGNILTTSALDYEYDRKITFTVTAVDAHGNRSDAETVEVRVNKVEPVDVSSGSSGSLAWLALLAAPFAALRRRKQK
ncbi:S8 family serine peptidase [Pseudoalteromonas sp. SS15]|uniref:S8 family serine peptidase n=1 Tax=Pseudoalteromonas sp. SS15 TaxID=3139393 RepID=UPI003BACAF7E